MKVNKIIIKNMIKNFEEIKKYPKKLIELNVTKEDWIKYSLWGRFGMGVAQVIGLLEINIIK